MASESDANLFVSDSAGTNSLSIPWPGDEIERPLNLRQSRESDIVADGKITMRAKRTSKGLRHYARGKRLKITHRAAIATAEKKFPTI